MRILIVNESLKLGGAETSSIELANALVRRPEITTVEFAAGPGELRNRIDDRIRLWELPQLNLWNIPKLIDHAARILRRINADVIHAHGATISWIFQKAKHVAGVNAPLILTHHSADIHRGLGLLNSYVMSSAADHFIALTHAKKAHFIKLGISEGRITMIPNGVSVATLHAQASRIDEKTIRDYWNIPQDAIVLVMVGRLIPSKRFDLFEEVVRRAHARDNRIIGVIVGDGPIRKKLEKNAPRCVRFLGYVKDIVVPIKISNIFVSSSHKEVLPMALIECGALGKPVVCSDLAAHREILGEPSCGVVVDKSNVDDYVKWIGVLVSNPHRAFAYAQALRKRIEEHFDIRLVCYQHVALYQALRSKSKSAYMLK